jgi:hypothetical protein
MNVLSGRGWRRMKISIYVCVCVCVCGSLFIWGSYEELMFANIYFFGLWNAYIWTPNVVCSLEFFCTRIWGC